ncbi:MAG: hypothetical protein H6822_27915 [Planctomycetaceae bacterium]|nr:hypothetical protein [Planctomycetales bacterium]MCB9926008.1 hypothetical protein [Planctomycetaceae bacterium]
MWRAFFAAIGAALLILGGECLVVEKAVLASSQEQATAPTSPFDEPQLNQPPARRELRPPEWAPWSLLSAGAVIMLYTFTLRRDGE